MDLTHPNLAVAPFPIAALALAWRSLETAQRDREQRQAAATGAGFEAEDLRASLAAAIDADTEAQVLLVREIVRAPANDVGDVLHKLAVRRDYAGEALAFAEEEDLLGSAGAIWSALPTSLGPLKRPAPKLTGQETAG
jgi:hypothetical protein